MTWANQVIKEPMPIWYELEELCNILPAAKQQSCKSASQSYCQSRLQPRGDVLTCNDAESDDRKCLWDSDCPQTCCSATCHFDSPTSSRCANVLDSGKLARCPVACYQGQGNSQCITDYEEESTNDCLEFGTLFTDKSCSSEVPDFTTYPRGYTVEYCVSRDNGKEKGGQVFFWFGEGCLGDWGGLCWGCGWSDRGDDCNNPVEVSGAATYVNISWLNQASHSFYLSGNHSEGNVYKEQSQAVLV